MRTDRFVQATLAVAILVTACKKDDDGSSPAPSPSAPMANAMLAVFDGHVQDAVQTFSVNATTGGVIQGNAGVTMVFPANAFRTQSGAMVTGNIQIELVEALAIGEMIWMNKQTLGKDNGQLRPLVSGGQYWVNATQSGQQLRLADNAGQVYVPASAGVDPNMELFVGSVASDGTIVWDPFANAALPQVDSSSYVFGNDTLGWVNCDYFMGSGAQTSVQVTCPAGHSEENTLMWLVFPDQNSITALHAVSGNVFGTNGYYTLPVGLNVRVVAISNIGGVHSSSISPTMSVAAGMDPSITFSSTTLEQFQIDVNAL